MVTLKHEKVKKVINVPTTVNEITPDVLEKLTSNITISKYHALVALCWKVSFADIFFNKGKDNGRGAQVIPLLAQAAIPEDSADEYKWLVKGKKLILTRSAIEMGTHVHVPNAASINSINAWAQAVAEAEHPGAKGININTLPKGEFILVEFKVVNLNDISGIIDGDKLADDPFLVDE